MLSLVRSFHRSRLISFGFDFPLLLTFEHSQFVTSWSMDAIVCLLRLSAAHSLPLSPPRSISSFMATSILSLAFSVLAFTFTISSPTKPNLLMSGQLAAPWDSTWALMMAVWISHSISSPGQLAEDKPWRKPISIWKIWNNPRLMAHPSNLLTFTTDRFAKATTYLFIYVYILPLTFSPAIFPVQIDDFSPVYTTYFRRLLFPNNTPITYHETLVRIIWTFLWALGPYLTLESAHALFAIFFVAILRTDEAEEWPPLFGSLAEAYGMRRFWGVFWHRLIVRAYSNFGRVLARRAGMERRMVVAFVVFGLSGLAHAATAWLFGDTYWGLDVVWFLGCFVVGAMETAGSQLMEKAIGQEPLWLALKRSGFSKGLAEVNSLACPNAPCAHHTLYGGSHGVFRGNDLLTQTLSFPTMPTNSDNLSPSDHLVRNRNLSPATVLYEYIICLLFLGMIESNIPNIHNGNLRPPCRSISPRKSRNPL
ncbi:uncharacterized protein MYCFIDRAFT_208814 [Pseudocercospora fijiensis CIRAD86]|uniref:Wax synthase domain-containing protein n=1 Tax=Pseudocercospora fijiensis (strain CIRAD86) TaxID=383855 RepID=M2ZK84_PSEFD|nr:uncharacterized protein MYCFIDRAFT_208814 [Pseudocercospora fijiensis CIRAD86]EME79514.1 hypothetical protein MYCFIDRAFT_208814 [Pseudocercospora fijiensis CIRAD86]